MDETDGYYKKHILMKCGFFIGLCLLFLVILILYSTSSVDAETTVAINDGSSVWINDNSGQALMLNLKIYNNSAGPGNQLNWINVTFQNIAGFDGSNNLSALTAGSGSGVVIYNETGSPGFDAGDQVANGAAPTWGNSGTHWWTNISINPSFNGIPDSIPAGYNYYVVIQTSANIKTGTQFRVNLTANAINGTWGNTTTLGNTQIIKADADDPTISYTYPTLGGDTSWYSADPVSPIDINFGWGGPGSSPMTNASYKVGSGSWVDIFSTPRTSDYSSNWGIPWGSISEGYNNIHLSVWDTAGNFRTHIYFPSTKGFRFLRDTSLPTITYANPSAGGNTNWYNSDPGNVINIDFAKGGTSKLINGTYRVGAGIWRNIFNLGPGGVDAYTTNWGVQWSDLSEGVNQITVRVYNKAGKITTHTYVTGSTGFQFRRDTVAPTINYNLYPGPGGSTNWYNSTPGSIIDIDFIWGSNSPLDNASYRIGSGTWVDIFSIDRSNDYSPNWGMLWSSLAEGSNQISIRVYDKAGNSLTHPYVALTSGFDFLKDETNPGITYTSPSAGATTNWYSTNPGNFINIDFIWIGDSPLDNASYRIGSSAWLDIFSSDQSSDYTTNWGLSWVSLAEGANSISIRVYDKAGNYVEESYAASASGLRVLKDTVAPGIVYNSPVAGDNTSWYKSDPGQIIDINFTWGSNSPLLNATYQIGSSPWVEIFSVEQSTDYTTDWGIDWSLLLNGENEIHIRIFDKAGNGKIEIYSMGTSGFIFKKDTQAPTLNSFSINGDATYSNSTTVTITISASDALSGIYQMRLSNDGTFDTESWEPYSSTKVWTLSPGDGVKNVYIQLRDNVFMESSGVLGDSIILDSTAPTISEYILTPANVTEDTSGTLNLTVNITDGVGSGVLNVWINYSINGFSTAGFEAMYNLGSGHWRTFIDPSDFSQTWDGLQNYYITYQIKVEDNVGNGLITTSLEEYIDPVNDPPVISGAPTELQVTVDTAYILDFSSYVSDVDNTQLELILLTDSSYVTVNGLVMTFNYPASVTTEEVTLSVSDGLASVQWNIDVTVSTVPIPKVIKTIQKDEVTARILIIISGNASITTGIQPPGSPPQNMLNMVTFQITTTDPNWDWTHITVDYSGYDPTKVDVTTLKLYYWDTSTSSWVLSDNNGIDLTNKLVYGNMTKLETFAVFGIEIDIKDDDNDGMDDDWELIHGLNTALDDSADDLDKDGLNNLEEFQQRTYPNNTDSDSDDLDDGWEVDWGLDPLIPTGDDGPDGDPDNDKHTNLDEFEHNTDPFDDTSFYKEPTDGKDGDDSSLRLYAGIIIVIIIILLLISYMMLSRRRRPRGDMELELSGTDVKRGADQDEFELEEETELDEVEEFEPDEGFEDWGGEPTEVAPLETIKPEVRTFEEAERMEVLELGVVSPCAVCQAWIAVGKDAFQCKCGLLSHPKCISTMDSCPQCGRDLDLEELGILPEGYELVPEEPEAEVPKPTKPMIRKEIKREVITASSPEAAYFIYIPDKTNESEIKQYLDGYFKSRKTGTESTDNSLKDVNIFISLNAAKKMLDHCYNKGREKEVMGLIIGETFEDQEKNKIFSVARGVATSDLDASEVDVRFQNFEKLFEHLEGLDYDYQILGWYHSHPDYSSFMSPTDVDTNRRMFKLPYQYAVVIDPIRFDMKAFTHDRLRKKKAKELPFAIFGYDKYKKRSGGDQLNGEPLTANKPLIRNEVKQELKELDTPPQRAYLTYLPGVTHDKDIQTYLKEFYNNKKIGRAVLTDGLGTEVTKFIEIGAARKMLEHCFKYRDSNEVMGLILGKRYQYKDRVLSISRDVATSELEATVVNVRFESFEKLFHQLDNLKYEYQILGWYHSHPGHTCFMSDTDVDTQKRMFIHPYQFALVIDPINFDVKGFTLDQRMKKNVKACGFAFIE